MSHEKAKRCCLQHHWNQGKFWLWMNTFKKKNPIHNWKLVSLIVECTSFFMWHTPESMQLTKRRKLLRSVIQQLWLGPVSDCRDRCWRGGVQWHWVPSAEQRPRRHGDGFTTELVVEQVTLSQLTQFWSNFLILSRLPVPFLYELLYICKYINMTIKGFFFFYEAKNIHPLINTLPIRRHEKKKKPEYTFNNFYFFVSLIDLYNQQIKLKDEPSKKN